MGDGMMHWASEDSSSNPFHMREGVTKLAEGKAKDES